MKTIWEYLSAKGFANTPRNEKRAVHLALESEKLNNRQKSRMGLLGLASKKLDGVYSLVTVIDGEARHWGRSGKAQSNTQILDERVEQTTFNLNPDYPYVFISEITADCPLADLSAYLNPNRVNASEPPDGLRDNFHDIITLEDFIRGHCEVPKVERVETLEKAFESVGNSQGIKRIPQLELSYGQAHHWAHQLTQKGYEGVVYSQSHAHWIAGARDETVIKFKEKLSFDSVVVGYTTGFKGGKYEGLIGSILVYFPAFGKPEGAPCEIPLSGMKDTQRESWMVNPLDIVGQAIKVDAKSYTATGNLREPRFKEIRSDKEAEFPVEFLGGQTFKSIRGGRRVTYNYRPKI